MTDVEFSFDPSCPWTWLTSRWLVDAASRREVNVTWRPLSLLVLAGGDVDERWRSTSEAGHRALRGVAALQAADRNDDAGRFYEAIGRLGFDAGAPLDRGIVDRAVAQAGVGDIAAALDDPAWDAAVESDTKRALDLAGPDVGSPVLSWSTVTGTGPDPSADLQRVAFHGPIVSPGPRGEDAARLLDVVLLAGATPGFFELKRGRSEGPALPAPPWT